MESDRTTLPAGGRRLKDMGDLQALLILAAPMGKTNEKVRKGKDRKSISTLATAIGVNTWTIYLWIKKGRLPPHRATQIVKVAEGRVTLDSLHPFVYS